MFCIISSLNIDISSIKITYFFFNDWNVTDPGKQTDATLLGLIRNALCTVVPLIFFAAVPVEAHTRMLRLSTSSKRRTSWRSKNDFPVPAFPVM